MNASYSFFITFDNLDLKSYKTSLTVDLGVLSIVNLVIGIYALFKSYFKLRDSGDDKMLPVLLL